jgi:putative ATP-binding cassette transporter
MNNPKATSPSSVAVVDEVWRIIRPFLALVLLATAFGVMAGLATAWLLGSVNEGLHRAGADRLPVVIQFGLLCLLSISGAAIAGVANSIAGQKIVAELRKNISARIIKAPLPLIEKYKSHNILAILSNDIDTVSLFTFNFAGYAVSAAIIIGSLSYLASLSLVAFALLVSAIVAGGAIGLYAKRGWARDYTGVREAQDMLQEQYRAITEGAKEIRMNAGREERVHRNHLSQAADTIARLKISAMRRFWIVDSVGNGILFLSIGMLLVLQDGLGMHADTATGAVLVMLYIRAPIEQLVNSLPAIFQAKIALDRVSRLSEGLSEISTPVRASGHDSLRPMTKLALKDTVYYFDSSEGSFQLGPLNLTVNAGEILFIVGENGSGKTTLIKVLLGLYAARSGELLVNGLPVAEEALGDHRQMFSAVFSDYFLFHDLLSLDSNLTARAMAYLEELEIAHKVDIHDGAFSTIDLSTGQRKRLALIHAYLEDRPIMLFDEWAADQDPTFRRVFYERILPDLKAQGKTLIVVSHDDRFFHCADHIITLREGRLIDEKFTPSFAPEPMASKLSV